MFKSSNAYDNNNIKKTAVKYLSLLLPPGTSWYHTMVPYRTITITAITIVLLLLLTAIMRITDFLFFLWTLDWNSL